VSKTSWCRYLLGTGLIALSIIFVLLLFYFGYIRFNYVGFERFPVQGLDVSHHQGRINWNVLRKGTYRFVYIKATEGAGFVDPQFSQNREAAIRNGFFVGAYHFFTMNKTGEKQALNFTRIVPRDAYALPPVIDLEFMGNSERHFSKSELVKELNIYISIIEKVYLKKPVLYSTYEFYDFYLSGSFDAYPIWIRDIFHEPKLIAKRPWTFWQYANRAKVEGIETFVDLNVFNGTMDDMRKLAR
jgi:lysozyme